MLCYSQEEFILLLSSSFLAVMVGLGTSAKHSMTLLDCIACVAAWDQHAAGELSETHLHLQGVDAEPGLLPSCQHVMLTLCFTEKRL